MKVSRQSRDRFRGVRCPFAVIGIPIFIQIDPRKFLDRWNLCNIHHVDESHRSTGKLDFRVSIYTEYAQGMRLKHSTKKHYQNHDPLTHDLPLSMRFALPAAPEVDHLPPT